MSKSITKQSFVLLLLLILLEKVDSLIIYIFNRYIISRVCLEEKQEVHNEGLKK